MTIIEAVNSTSTEDMNLISAIVAKTKPYDWLKAEMDIAYCHAAGCKLDLKSMADSHNLLDINHDVAGIMRHIDRSTGQLKECFTPRFALPEKPVRQTSTIEWVPCSEEMPMESVRVMAMEECGRIHIILWNDGMWLTDDDDDEQEVENVITHWAYLPDVSVIK